MKYINKFNKFKAIIGLTVVSLVLAGCAGSGDGNNSTNPSTPANINLPLPNTPSQQTINYSQTSCGSIEECSNACDLSYPYVGTAEIQALCTSPDTGIVSANCVSSTYGTLNTPYLSSNAICKNNNMVTQIINIGSIGSPACSTDSDCYSYCSDLYKPESAQAIEEQGAAEGSAGGGETLQLLFSADALVAAQLAACLAAPANFVLP